MECTHPPPPPPNSLRSTHIPVGSGSIRWSSHFCALSRTHTCTQARTHARELAHTHFARIVLRAHTRIMHARMHTHFRAPSHWTDTTCHHARARARPPTHPTPPTHPCHPPTPPTKRLTWRWRTCSKAWTSPSSCRAPSSSSWCCRTSRRQPWRSNAPCATPISRSTRSTR
jgi:hypothetical protein